MLASCVGHAPLAKRSYTPHAAARPALGRLLSPRPLPPLRALSWEPADATIDAKDVPKLEMLVKRFEAADKDGNGRIDPEELRALLESTACDTVDEHLQGGAHWLSEHEVARLLSRYDLDCSGDLTFDEFQMLMSDGLLMDEKLAAYKAAFDAAVLEEAHSAVGARGGGGGAPTLSAARAVQLVLGMGVGGEGSQQSAEQLVERFDADRDGRVSFNDLLALLRHTTLDVEELLAYLGARPQSPGMANTIIHAIGGSPYVRTVCNAQQLDSALAAARSGQLVLLLAGTTWCGDSRAAATLLNELAGGYSSGRFLVLWGNVGDAAKELFRDRLKVRSTPAVFMWRDGELIFSGAAPQAGGGMARIEAELRRRLAPDDVPPAPLLK